MLCRRRPHVAVNKQFVVQTILLMIKKVLQSCNGVVSERSIWIQLRMFVEIRLECRCSFRTQKAIYGPNIQALRDQEVLQCHFGFRARIYLWALGPRTLNMKRTYVDVLFVWIKALGLQVVLQATCSLVFPPSVDRDC